MANTSSKEFPKVGDYIVITKSKLNWNSAGEMDPWVGTVQKVTEIANSNIGKVHFYGDGGWSWTAKDKHFRKATPLEVRKYKQRYGTYSLETCECMGDCPEGTRCEKGQCVPIPKSHILNLPKKKSPIVVVCKSLKHNLQMPKL